MKPILSSTFIQDGLCKCCKKVFSSTAVCLYLSYIFIYSLILVLINKLNCKWDFNIHKGKIYLTFIRHHFWSLILGEKASLIIQQKGLLNKRSYLKRVADILERLNNTIIKIVIVNLFATHFTLIILDKKNLPPKR